MKVETWMLAAIEEALEKIPEDLTGKAIVLLEFNMNHGGVGTMHVEPKWRSEIRPPVRLAVHGRT
jgi:hypothetical protein